MDSTWSAALDCTCCWREAAVVVVVVVVVVQGMGRIGSDRPPGAVVARRSCRDPQGHHPHHPRRDWVSA